MAIHLRLNPALRAATTQEEVKAAFQAARPFASSAADVQVVAAPFACLVLDRLVGDAEAVRRVEGALARCVFKPKMNDLYTFHQTADFGRSKRQALASVRSFFLRQLLPWLQTATGLPLQDGVVDIGASRYTQSDVLLCHDDELEGRRLAFVWYLVPDDWADADGGHLDLLACDERLTPGRVVHSLLPRRDRLVLFEVSPKSWHQVREVVSRRTRLSVNGWFHGPPLPRPPRPPADPPALLTPAEIDEQLLYSWVDRKYLRFSTQSDIHDRMLADSQLLLVDFLHADKYAAVVDALRTVAWTTHGPPNHRSVDLVDADACPDPVRQLFRLLSSEAMLVVLADMTGLSLHPLASRVETPAKRRRVDAPLGRVSGQVRRWTRGRYTLVADSDLCCAALDVCLFLGCERWNSDMGGFVSYIAKDDDDELLCVEPTANALALVYRDDETLRFVKYVNNTVTSINDEGAFYDFSFVFTEPPELE